MNTSVSRSKKLSHASPDRDSRLTKARRIEEILLASGIDLESTSVLDIGTGSGTIASYLVSRVGSLRSVDVVDERADTDFEFQLVESEVLPFQDDSFDVAISNHVIEHVDDQLKHLQEIARVLKPGGICYLATPNRLWPMEPHFHLPFLAWIPSRVLRDRYVQATHRGRAYDAELLTPWGLTRLAGQAGLRVQDASFEIASSILRPKSPIDISFLKPAWPVVRRLLPSMTVRLRTR